MIARGSELLSTDRTTSRKDDPAANLLFALPSLIRSQNALLELCDHETPDVKSPISLPSVAHAFSVCNIHASPINSGSLACPKLVVGVKNNTAAITNMNHFIALSS